MMRIVKILRDLFAPARIAGKDAIAADISGAAVYVILKVICFKHIPVSLYRSVLLL